MCRIRAVLPSFRIEMCDCPRSLRAAVGSQKECKLSVFSSRGALRYYYDIDLTDYQFHEAYSFD